jgi:hypothetical protein
MDSRLVTGAVLGGLLGAALSWASVPGPADADDNAALRALQSFAWLPQDRTMFAALQEPTLLFLQVDRASAMEFLRSADELVALFGALRAGQCKPSLVSDALRVKREASNRLMLLQRQARQTRPLTASEVEEDILTVSKILEGYVHNCMQQSNLNLMET